MNPAVALRRRLSPLYGLVKARDYWPLARALRLAPGHTTVLGYPIRYSDNIGLIHSVREIFADEVYRFESAGPVPRIIDAGANIGLSVLYFKRIHPSAEIVAYEPDPAIFEMLAANTAGLPGVTLHRAAAWTEDTVLTFHSEGSLAGSSEVVAGGEGTRSITVDAVRLRAEILKAPVDFLKIDIEGAENAVLFDIADALDGVENLFFEYHSIAGKAQRLGEMLDLVTAAGFRYVIDGAHGPRYPFTDRVAEGFDLQVNVSCYRDRHLAGTSAR